MTEQEGRLVLCDRREITECDQWYWEGPQERPHLLRFPTECPIHGQMED